MKTGLHIAIAAACVAAWPSVSPAQVTYTLPERAQDVEQSTLQPDVNEQVAFWIEETFPSKSVVQHYEGVFSGWPTCRQEGGGDWQSFYDASRGRRAVVHQFARFWVSPTNSIAISLFLRYESRDVLSEKKPDNTRQVVYLLQYRTTDARKHLGELGAVCDKGN